MATTRYLTGRSRTLTATVTSAGGKNSWFIWGYGDWTDAYGLVHAGESVSSNVNFAQASADALGFGVDMHTTIAGFTDASFSGGSGVGYWQVTQSIVMTFPLFAGAAGGAYSSSDWVSPHITLPSPGGPENISHDPPYYAVFSTLYDAPAADLTLEVSIEVEEYCDITVIPLDESGFPISFPGFGGDAVPDAPFYTTIVFGERTKMGGAYSMTATGGGGASATYTGTFTETDDIDPFFYRAGAQPGLLNGPAVQWITNWYTGATETPDNFIETTEVDVPAGVADSITVTTSFPGAPLAFSLTGEDGAVDAASGTCSINANPYISVITTVIDFPQDDFGSTVDSGDVISYSVEMSFEQGMRKSCSLNGALKDMTADYPRTMRIYVDRASNDLAHPFDVSGSIGDTNDQVINVSSGSVGGLGTPLIDPPAATINTMAPMKIWTAPAMAEGGISPEVDTTDWRGLFRGFIFPTFSLSQSSPTPVASCLADTTQQWIAGPNTSVSADGDFIKIVVDGGEGSVAFAGGMNAKGNRYLDLKFFSDTGQGDATWTLTLSDGKQWNNILIHENPPDTPSSVDLCDPTSATESVDQTDTRWPVYPDSDFWGVGEAGGLQFSNIPEGIYHLQGVELVINKRLVDFCPAFGAWVDDGSGSGTVVRRFLLGNTDGRQSMEETDFVKVPDIFGTPGVNPVIVSLSELVTAIGTPADKNPNFFAAENSFSTAGCGAVFIPGVNLPGDPVPPLKDCYLNNSLPAVCAQGGGLFYSAASGWVSGLDFALPDDNTPKQIQAQALFDVVDWYPGAGDVFGLSDGAYGDTTPLAWGKIFDGQGWGSVFAGGAPAETQTVKMYRMSDQLLIDTTNPGGGGNYITPSPDGQGTIVYDVDVPDNGPGAFVSSRPFFARKRHRACFSVPPPDNGCNRMCVIERGPSGAGRRIVSDGTNIAQTEYFDVRGGLAQIASERAGAVIAAGRAPTGCRDGAGIWHLWYSRTVDGTPGLYYIADFGNGWSAETMAITGYDCPGTVYVRGLDRVYMAAWASGRIKFMIWKRANPGDSSLTLDTSSIADIGAADSSCPTLERLEDGSIQIWWRKNGVLYTSWSIDGGATWTAPA